MQKHEESKGIKPMSLKEQNAPGKKRAITQTVSTHLGGAKGKGPND